MLNPLEYQFKNTLNKYGYDAIVNGLDQVRILLKEYEEGTSTTDYKYMLFRNGFIKQGDIITIFDNNWIVMHEDMTINDVYTKVIIRRLKFSINFNFAGDIKAIPSAIDEGTYRLDDGNVITLSEGRIILHLQENEVSKQIAKEQRFLIMGNPWQVVQKTNTEHGIYKIYADIGIFNEDDDEENEIADRWEYETKDNYTIKINNVVGSPLPLDSTLQLNISTTKNGEVATIPLTCTSSNIDVLAVNDTGLVSCVGVGTSTITVAVTEKLTVKDTIALSVEEVEEVEPTYTIIGQTQYAGDPDNEISINSWCKYTVNKLVDDVEVEGNFTFVLDSTKATLSEITSNSCKVSVGNIYGTSIAKLIVTDVDTNKVAIEKEITIKGR